MRALTYLLRTTIVNYFKRLKEKPLKAIGPIFMILWLSIMFIPHGKSAASSMPEYIFVTGFVIFTIIVFLFSLYTATKRVDSKFTMSDVNLVFVSPIRPQTIMLYGIVKKIAIELLTSFYIIYQIPNALRSFNVPGIRQVMLIAAYLIFQLVLCNIVKLLVFALSTKYKNLGTIIRNSIKALIIFIVAGTAYTIIKGSFLDFFKSLFNTITYSTWVGYIPVFGWMKEIALQTITGLKVSYVVYVILILLASGVLLYATYSMELDFYEDMLTSAENNELIREAKSGKAKGMAANGKQPAFLKAFKNVTLKLDGAYGAKVLFFKHMNEYFKRSFIFFINTYSLILLVVSILLGITAKGMDIKFIFLPACGLLFFAVGFGGKIYTEISNPFIYLLPDSPQKKLFYGIASSLVKILTDAVLLFLPFGLLGGASLLEILLCIVCYLALGGMLSYSGLLGFRIAEALGFTGPVSQGLLFALFQMLLMVAAVIIVIILSITLKALSGYALYAATLAYSIGGAALFSLGCVGMFEGMDIG